MRRRRKAKWSTTAGTINIKSCGNGSPPSNVWSLAFRMKLQQTRKMKECRKMPKWLFKYTQCRQTMWSARLIPISPPCVGTAPSHWVTFQTDKLKRNIQTMVWIGFAFFAPRLKVQERAVNFFSNISFNQKWRCGRGRPWRPSYRAPSANAWADGTQPPAPGSLNWLQTFQSSLALNFPWN